MVGLLKLMKNSNVSFLFDSSGLIVVLVYLYLEKEDGRISFGVMFSFKKKKRSEKQYKYTILVLQCSQELNYIEL